MNLGALKKDKNKQKIITEVIRVNGCSGQKFKIKTTNILRDIRENMGNMKQEASKKN